MAQSITTRRLGVAILLVGLVLWAAAIWNQSATADSICSPGTEWDSGLVAEFAECQTVFLADLDFAGNDTNQASYRAKVGTGGQLYSIDFGTIGEVIATQHRSSSLPPTDPKFVRQAPWIDEVFQTVVNRRGLIGSVYSIHQAGGYTTEPGQARNAVPTLSSVRPNSVVVHHTGEQARPANATNPSFNDIRFESRTELLSDGALEVSTTVISTTGGGIERLVVPWGGIRKSKLTQFAEPTSNTVNNPGYQWSPTSLSGLAWPTNRDGLADQGWAVFAESTSPSGIGNEALGVVYGTGLDDVRVGSVNSPERDLFVIAAVDLLDLCPNGRYPNRVDVTYFLIPSNINRVDNISLDHLSEAGVTPDCSTPQDPAPTTAATTVPTTRATTVPTTTPTTRRTTTTTRSTTAPTTRATVAPTTRATTQTTRSTTAPTTRVATPTTRVTTTPTTRATVGPTTLPTIAPTTAPTTGATTPTTSSIVAPTTPTSGSGTTSSSSSTTALPAELGGEISPTDEPIVETSTPTTSTPSVDREVEPTTTTTRNVEQDQETEAGNSATTAQGFEAADEQVIDDTANEDEAVAGEQPPTDASTNDDSSVNTEIVIIDDSPRSWTNVALIGGASAATGTGFLMFLIPVWARRREEP